MWCTKNPNIATSDYKYFTIFHFLMLSIDHKAIIISKCILQFNFLKTEDIHKLVMTCNTVILWNNYNISIRGKLSLYYM